MRIMLEINYVTPILTCSYTEISCIKEISYMKTNCLDGVYQGENLDYLAFPMGGIGAGMVLSLIHI